MTAPRRIGAEDSATRAALLDAALELMLEEGYAAVTSRRVAAKAGLKPQLVHYYFRTMDDLFLAVVRRGAEHNLERQARALASPQPLRALWEMSTDRRSVQSVLELSALGNHRKEVRAELSEYAKEFRRLQAQALSNALAEYGVDGDMYPTEAVLFLMTAISQILALEEALDMRAGHAEIRALVERLLTQVEGPARRG